MESDVLAEQALHQDTLRCGHHTVLSPQDTRPTTRLTSVVLYAMVKMAILLEALGATPWAGVSHDHRWQLASLASVPDVGHP
jgi:hypothetical protein